MVVQRLALVVVRLRAYVVLVALLLASLGLMALDPVRVPGVSVLWLVSIGMVQRLTGGLLHPGGLERENELLRQLNTELMLEVTQLRRAFAENQQLRQLLGLREQRFPEAVPAEVLGITIGQLQAFATLNRGAADGLRPGMPVLSPFGLLGSVRAVSQHFAVVELLENRHVRVAVRLQSSGAEGILAWEEEGKFVVHYVPSSIPVQAGERVVTSAASDRFPPDLPIGVVRDVQREPTLPFHRIVVAPLVPARAVRYVVVLRHVPNPERRALEERFLGLTR
ncbi:Cell shape-determining protein MreC [bacterium HR21]|jgi:rod shape-determining protein MreC|nr:Cell shape-determining protein MreC [bacterium HR21]